MTDKTISQCPKGKYWGLQRKESFVNIVECRLYWNWNLTFNVCNVKTFREGKEKINRYLGLSWIHLRVGCWLTLSSQFLGSLQSLQLRRLFTVVIAGENRMHQHREGEPNSQNSCRDWVHLSVPNTENRNTAFIMAMQYLCAHVHKCKITDKGFSEGNKINKTLFLPVWVAVHPHHIFNFHIILK